MQGLKASSLVVRSTYNSDMCLSALSFGPHSTRPLLRAAWLLAALLTSAVSFSADAQTPGAQRQDPAILVARAQDLLQQLAAAYPGTASISVTPPASFDQPACTQIEANLAGARLQSRTSVAVRCVAPHPWTTYLQASVRIMGSYFVASGPIRRGTAIGAQNVTRREGDLLRNRRALSDATHVIGWIAARFIPAGSPIGADALQDPNAVQRGQQVRTVARGSSFVASGEGQALGSGSPGAQIQVRTPSGRIITGTVIDAHTVQVMM